MSSLAENSLHPYGVSGGYQVGCLFLSHCRNPACLSGALPMLSISSNFGCEHGYAGVCVESVHKYGTQWTSLGSSAYEISKGSWAWICHWGFPSLTICQCSCPLPSSCSTGEGRDDQNYKLFLWIIELYCFHGLRMLPPSCASSAWWKNPNPSLSVCKCMQFHWTYQSWWCPGVPKSVFTILLCSLFWREACSQSPGQCHCLHRCKLSTQMQSWQGQEERFWGSNGQQRPRDIFSQDHQAPAGRAWCNGC